VEQIEDDPSAVETTKLLGAWRDGDQDALEQLISRVYDELSRLAHGPADEVIALAELLERLGHEEPRAASVVDLVFFGGLTQEEAATALKLSLSTVERDLRFAKNWLRLRLRS
jgi:DNA-directed RNA polymerase specialized sigma subunit